MVSRCFQQDIYLIRSGSDREGLNTLSTVAVTMGDPCGVGPEVIVKAFDSPGFPGECSVLVVGDPLPIERAIKLLGSSAVILPITGQMLRSFRSGTLSVGEGVIPLLSVARPKFGYRTYAGGYGIRQTNTCCVRNGSVLHSDAAGLACAGSVDAVCTCPINKEQLHRQGFPFPGHTEFLRELTGAEDVVMMLAGPTLRVALVTIHESLADVPGLLTKELLRKVIRITVESMLRDFAMRSPALPLRASIRMREKPESSGARKSRLSGP